MVHSVIFLLLTIGVLLLAVSAIPSPLPTTIHNSFESKAQPSEEFTNYQLLDDTSKYEVFWKHNETHIVFEVHVETTGYIGFGLSYHGKMYPADVVLGWVKDGKTYFQDRHTIGHYEPIIDQSQDWHLLAGKEENGKTMLKFVRKLVSCDENDLKIEVGTTKVIYAWHNEDPIHETGLTYHGATNRGARNLLLLNPTQHRYLPSNAKHFDFFNKKFHLPAVMTYYHCTSFKLPDIGGKNHMIMFEPIIEEKNVEFVHHIVVYHCPPSSQYADNLIGQQYECYENSPREFSDCRAIHLAWAVGGGPFYFPKDVGMPIGESSDSGVYILETHYNNPTLKSGVIDSSGLRMHYTPTLRKIDGDIMQTGLAVDKLHIVPPGYNNFLSTGYCGSVCTNKYLQGQPDGIKVFGIFPHSHLLGAAVRARIIRDGVETVISDDEHYDFDYQESRLLNEAVTVKAGDVIEIECKYKSDHKKSITYGGLSTDEEMCLVFLMYYPRVDIGQCSSLPIYNQYMPFPNSPNFHGMQSRLEQMDWTNSTTRTNFQRDTDKSRHYFSCLGKDGFKSFSRTEEDPPLISKKYQPTITCPKILIG